MTSHNKIMEITKDEDNLIVKIPLKHTFQDSYDDNIYHTVDNIVGVVEGNNYTINYLSYLDYKDTYQAGMPILTLTAEEFDFAVELLNLNVMFMDKPKWYNE